MYFKEYQITPGCFSDFDSRAAFKISLKAPLAATKRDAPQLPQDEKVPASKSVKDKNTATRKEYNLLSYCLILTSSYLRFSKSDRDSTAGDKIPVEELFEILSFQILNSKTGNENFSTRKRMIGNII